MKLSEAIRAGAKLRPQTRAGSLFFDGGSCALGAAGEAMGLPYFDEDVESFAHFSNQLTSFFPVLGVINREGLQREASLVYFQIIRYNDNLGYTREEIADWLEAQGY